jgi:hypothetical protein
MQDTQIAGVYDDGSEGGALRVGRADTGIVLVPFADIPTSVESNSSTTTISYYSDLAGPRQAGYGAFTATLTDSAKYSRLRFTFNGPTLGIWCGTPTPNPQFDVFIDGVPYRVDPTRLIWDSQTEALDGGLNYQMVARDLSDTLHHADIVLMGQTGKSRTWALYGIAVAKSAGYRDYDSTGWLFAQGPYAVPVAGATLTTLGFTTMQLRKLWFVNSTGGAVVATLKHNTAITWSKSVPANDTVELDLGGLVSMSPGLWSLFAGSDSALTVIGVGRK